MFGALNKDGDEQCLLLWLFDVKGSTEFISNAARHHQSPCQCPGSQSNTGWGPGKWHTQAHGHAGHAKHLCVHRAGKGTIPVPGAGKDIIPILGVGIEGVIPIPGAGKECIIPVLGVGIEGVIPVPGAGKGIIPVLGVGKEGIIPISGSGKEGVIPVLGPGKEGIIPGAGKEGTIPVPGAIQAHTPLQTLLPRGCSCGEHSACTIPLLSTPQGSHPSRVIQGKRGTGCKLPVRTQGCRVGGLAARGGLWGGQAAPSRSHHLPLLQKDAVLYHHPVRLTGTRINEFLISTPSFSSLPRGYTPTAPQAARRRWGGGCCLQG